MANGDDLKEWIVLTASALLAAILWVPVVWLSNLGLGSQGGLWYVAAYPLMVVASFIIGRWHPGRPWALAVVMTFASYTAALLFIPGTGELLPFEVLIMLVLTIPIALAAKWGSRYGKQSRHVSHSG